MWESRITVRSNLLNMGKCGVSNAGMNFCKANHFFFSTCAHHNQPSRHSKFHHVSVDVSISLDLKVLPSTCQCFRPCWKQNSCMDFHCSQQVHWQVVVVSTKRTKKTTTYSGAGCSLMLPPFRCCSYSIHTWCLIASGLVACFFWKPNPSYTNRKDSECEKKTTLVCKWNHWLWLFSHSNWLYLHPTLVNMQWSWNCCRPNVNLQPSAWPYLWVDWLGRAMVNCMELENNGINGNEFSERNANTCF